MAQFTINHNGLPLLQANNITIDVPPPPPVAPPFFVELNPLSNDDLGFTPTFITEIDDSLWEESALAISEDSTKVILEQYSVTTENVFTYTIKDAFDRESTATVTLNFL